MGHDRGLRFLVDTIKLVKVLRIGGMILKVLQTVKGYSQCISAIYSLTMIISECESKLKIPCR